MPRRGYPPGAPLELIHACPVLDTRPIIGAVPMHGIIYLVGLIVVIMAILSFFGLR